MSVPVYKYRVWCDTDAKWEYVWADANQGEPTACPTDTAHSIDTSKTSVVDKVVEETITVKEENIPTGGHYQAVGVTLDVPAGSGTVYNKDTVFPHPVSLMAAEWNNKPGTLGDSIMFVVGPDTIVGALTANAASGATVLNVQDSVIENTKIGYHIKLFNAPATQIDCGRCLEVNAASGTITIEEPLPQQMLAATPTYVQMEVHLLCKTDLMEEGRCQLGEAKIGGSYLPKDTIIRAKYFNNNGTAKKLTFIMEYLY